MFKNMKKILCNVLAVVGVGACAGTFGACETNEPKVELEISFNGETYTLEYNLFRKITPTTVKHFLALVENEYYNGLCVHDYQAGEAMYTGGYKYVDSALEYVDYTQTVKDYIPQSVWSDGEKTVPTYTLYGECKANKFEVTNGALQQRFGALVMYYETNGSNLDAYVERNQGGVARRDYEKNSATSMFSITLSATVKNNDNYCVFAMLADNSVEELSALKSAIEDYVETTYDNESDFVSVKYGDVLDHLLGESEKAYDVPNQPIVIEKATVIRY